jgi:hypothetical protein
MTGFIQLKLVACGRTEAKFIFIETWEGNDFFLLAMRLLLLIDWVGVGVGGDVILLSYLQRVHIKLLQRGYDEDASLLLTVPVVCSFFLTYLILKVISVRKTLAAYICIRTPDFVSLLAKVFCFITSF